MSDDHSWIQASCFTYDRFREDPGQGHWYDDIFLNDQVKSFVTQALEGNETALPSASRSFTLTVASPADVGSLHGWCIRKLRIPGRWVDSLHFPTCV